MKRLLISMISGLVSALAISGSAFADEDRRSPDTIADVVRDAVERIETVTRPAPEPRPEEAVLRAMPFGGAWAWWLEQREPDGDALADRLPKTSPLRWWLERRKTHEDRHATR